MTEKRCARCGDVETFGDVCARCEKTLFAPYVCERNGDHVHQGCAFVPPNEERCRRCKRPVSQHPYASVKPYFYCPTAVPPKVEP